jgi:hypothetical protein
MSMSHSRYNQIRERIFFLFNIINNRAFPVFIAPKSLMSIEELRGRYEVKQEGYANDGGYYDNPQSRNMTCPQLIDILPNLTTPDELGFGNANVTVVQMYESLQEYIGLWCEIANNAPEFKTPPMKELRWLETLAWTLFPTYKRVKHFVIDYDIEKQLASDRALNKMGLMGLSMLFDYSKKKGDISFISHLDGLSGNSDDIISAENFMSDRPMVSNIAVQDSLSQLESNDTTASEWLFRG